MFTGSWHSPHQSLSYPGIQPEINKRKRKELRFYLGRKVGVGAKLPIGARYRCYGLPDEENILAHKGELPKSNQIS